MKLVHIANGQMGIKIDWEIKNKNKAKLFMRMKSGIVEELRHNLTDVAVILFLNNNLKMKWMVIKFVTVFSDLNIQIFFDH